MQRAQRVLLLRVHGEDQDGQTRFVLPDELEHLQSTLAGHRDVKDHKVPVLLGDHLQRLGSVGCFAGNDKVVGIGQDLLDTIADDGMVVG